MARKSSPIKTPAFKKLSTNEKKGKKQMSIFKRSTKVKRRCVCPKCKRTNVNLYPYGLFGWRCFKCGGRIREEQ